QAAGRAGLFADLPRRPLPAPGALPAPGTLPGPGALAGFTGTAVNGPAGLNGPGRLRGPAQPSTDEPVTGPPLPRRTPTGGGADESGSDGRPPDGTDAGPDDARQRPGPGELGGVGAPGRPATPGPNGPRP